MEILRSLTLGAFLLFGFIFFYSSEEESCNEVVCAPIVSRQFGVEKLKESLQKRGPNSQCVLEIDNTVIFAGFVLRHQGSSICNQPVESEKHVLLFNGDVFNLDKSDTYGGKSDTEWMFEKLSSSKTEEELINSFRTIEGPFCFVFYDKIRGNLYFARDSLGRNSMLLENNKEHFRVLSSSRIDGEKESMTVELPPLGIYKINKKDFNSCTMFPWQRPDEFWRSQASMLEKIGMKICIQYAIEPLWLSEPDISGKFSFSFYGINSEKCSSTTQLYENLLISEEVSEALNEFSDLLENSVKQRVQLTTELCAKCPTNRTSCSHSKIAILFSGGIDCSILALLSDKFVRETDSIDLINVAFEASNAAFRNWNVPDRESAKSSLITLTKLCPSRKWNFIEVNVTRKELYTHLSNNIKHLIYPLNTVLDESIGCAFWFASQGKGLLCEDEFESSAKVVILGSGADELFGGYVRHKNAYNRCTGTDLEKEKSLHKELEKDWQRIPSRNLARDDRVISDSGKTPRSPFIEESLVKFTRSLRPNQRCCFLYEDGVGDKLFLRLYGYRLGLTGPAFLKKRAIQFGSKIANKKENASDRSAYMGSLCGMTRIRIEE